MDSKRILYVSQEIHPYLPENEISKPSLELPKKMNEKGNQVRVFMPRYGLINERRHQLHEVIRLSGINIQVNDMDQPLVIKVASIPQARMQVYFIDNDQYFKRKSIFYNEDDQFHPDNHERAVFFTRSIFETLKKLGWSPDIIHCHGWMASLLPLYLRTLYSDDPVFQDSKVVLSAYGGPEEKLSAKLADNLSFHGIDAEHLKGYKEATTHSLYEAALPFIDALALTGAKLEEKQLKSLQEKASNCLDLTQSENPMKELHKLYDQLTVEEEVA